MKAIMNDGTIKEIDTSFMFDNQYDTIDGKRIYDTQIQRIEDDIRLGDFYCCSKKQGTYNEVQEAINEERSHIHDCKNCFWYQVIGRVEDKCHNEKIVDENEETIIETKVYVKGCKYTSAHSKKKCVHDIEETPKLFREVQDCFFCNHPNGVPDMTDFIEFMIKNHKEYNLVSRYDDETISAYNSFNCNKKFASYVFSKNCWDRYFILHNARNTFKFIFDFNTKSFILYDAIGYKEVKRFEASIYNSARQKSISMSIAGWDKFYKWFIDMVDDYLAQK